MPLQFHVGYGDNDVDLRGVRPAAPDGFLRATQDRGVPVLLLHNYPFHRNAAYLAQVFDHAFMDIGLATHNTGALSAALVRETSSWCRSVSSCFSDAYGLAELYHLAALLFRRGLSQVLTGLVGADEMTLSTRPGSAGWWPGRTPGAPTVSPREPGRRLARGLPSRDPGCRGARAQLIFVASRDFWSPTCAVE